MTEKEREREREKSLLRKRERVFAVQERFVILNQ
jgi:hypothetical protein